MKNLWIEFALAALICAFPGCGNNAQNSPETSRAAASREPQTNSTAQWVYQAILNRARTNAEQILRRTRDEARNARLEAVKRYEQQRERGEKAKKIPPFEAQISKSFQDILPQPRHAALIAKLYNLDSDAPQNPIFIQNHTLTAAGRAILDAAQHADDHALPAGDFPTDRILQAIQYLDQLQRQIEQTKPYDILKPHEIRALDHALNERHESLPPPGDGRANDILQWLCDFKTTPIERLAAQCARKSSRILQISRLEQDIEFALADLWLQWAETLKFGNLEKFSPEEISQYTTPDGPNDIHPRHYDEIIASRLYRFSAPLFQSPDSAPQRLQSLTVSHEQYPKLQNVREYYRNIVAQGGWKTVPPDKMFEGGRAPLVAMLKTRLQREGYYQGGIDDVFDPPLTKAIRQYQKHHQLEETGRVDDVFWRSLNVPAQQRLAEIEANIRRWHKTMFEPRDTYIDINIPSFTVEIWKNGKRISQHRTVVGNAARICNTRTREWEFINATKLMHARMTYLVFNPYWNVPPRIEVDEYRKKMEQDPKWLENSDFEYYTPRGGGRVLRQKPGEHNALGKVKLIFPNRFNIYLHDTPNQSMFSYPVRAFSHGCIRVEGAFDFAREVLQLDGQWDGERVGRFFTEKGEHPVELNTPIDVFIDYHTVTVDDSGAPYFLADVYKIIKNEISPPPARDRQCNPETDKTSAFRAGTSDDSGP